MLCRDEAEAEDLAQETMLKAYRGIGSFSEGTNVRAWLMVILRNTRIDRIRAAAASAGDVSLDQMMIDPEDRRAGPAEEDPAWANPQELVESFSDRQVIQALQDLPEEIRWTLLLVDVEGMDHVDAAKVLDVPVGTIKSRAHRGAGDVAGGAGGGGEGKGDGGRVMGGDSLGMIRPCH